MLPSVGLAMIPFFYTVKLTLSLVICDTNDGDCPKSFKMNTNKHCLFLLFLLIYTN